MNKDKKRAIILADANPENSQFIGKGRYTQRGNALKKASQKSKNSSKERQSDIKTSKKNALIKKGITQFPCDRCGQTLHIRELTLTGKLTACQICIDDLPDKPTDTEQSLLIWLYNNQHFNTIDSGNLIFAYGEIVKDKDFDIKAYHADIHALMIRGFVATHTLDTFFKITQKGIEYIDTQCPQSLIFQCDRCGDLWSPDIDDPMLLEAYLAEHPDGHVSIEECETCETNYNALAEAFDEAMEDEDNDMVFVDEMEDPNLHSLYKALADQAEVPTDKEKNEDTK